MEKSTSASAKPSIDYHAVEKSDAFRTLQKKHRNFVFPLTIAALVWYFGYVLLAAYARDFMATPVFGLINVGLLLGLSQFVMTFLITMLYVRFATRTLDPKSATIRAELEGNK